MATFQLPSAVDPAVRMALTLFKGGQKYLHGYSVNSYHIRSDYNLNVNSCQGTACLFSTLFRPFLKTQLHWISLRFLLY